jgi:hypothetical protein
MFTFQGQFMPHFSETTAVLCELLAAENEFCWNVRHTEAFNGLKHALCNASLLHYFQPGEEAAIQGCTMRRAAIYRRCTVIGSSKVVECRPTSRALTTTENEVRDVRKGNG